MAIINQKGGVGKTTTTVNLGAALAIMGKKVLLLDLDPQSHLTLHLSPGHAEYENTLAHVLLKEKRIRDCIEKTSTQNLHFVPGTIELASCENLLQREVARELFLREALKDESIESYDLLLFDCPPSLGVLTLNALSAANKVLVPVQAEFFSLQGLSRLVEILDLVKKRLNPSLELTGVLPCMVDSRRSLTGEVINELQRFFQGKLLSSRVRISVKLAEAPGFGKTIFQHAPTSHGAEDYFSLAYELLEILGFEKREFESKPKSNSLEGETRHREDEK